MGIGRRLGSLSGLGGGGSGSGRRSPAQGQASGASSRSGSPGCNTPVRANRAADHPWATDPVMETVRGLLRYVYPYQLTLHSGWRECVWGATGPCGPTTPGPHTPSGSRCAAQGTMLQS
jgi:hypothetical protein